MNAASLRTIRSRIMYVSLLLSTLTVYPVVLKFAGLGGPCYTRIASQPSLETTSLVQDRADAVCGTASTSVADCNASQGIESSSEEQCIVHSCPGENCTAQEMVTTCPKLVSSFIASEQCSVQVASNGSVLLLLHEIAIGLPGLFVQFFLYMAYILFDLYTFRHEMKILNEHVKVLEDQLESLEKGTNALIYKSFQRFYEVMGTSPAFAETWSMQNALP